MLRGCKVLAMEYSPECSIPYLSRVDAGTVEFLRRIGMRVISSGDLVQRFEAAWDAAAIETHRAASERLYRIKDRAFEYIGARLSAGESPTEYEVQQRMVGWFQRERVDERLRSDRRGPGARRQPALRPVRRLLDGRFTPTSSCCWICGASSSSPAPVYADITWVGFGGTPPEEIAKAFDVIVAGRDAAVGKVQAAVAAGQELQGWEVDRAARDVITAAGYGRFFIHRTGHSLGEEVHGNGVHMDDYETHDDRKLVPGTGFTIEPGIYTETFGVRTEINMVAGERTATVTGPCQQTLVRIVT